ncbi:MAG: hypothetical protein JST01_08630 [Cyanobacteria bacterium SZAS TMP-1]|nr:hypothetical protein [Cyanobacteria bacterium SZAS TMP-1]
MSKFSRAAMGGLLFAFWLMCFVFPISLIMSFGDHTPIGTFLGQMIVDFFVLWFICGVIAHGVIDMFDDMNKRRRDDDRPSDKKDDQDRNDNK